MSKPRPLPWDDAEEDHLLFLRDREKLRFNVIGPRLGRSPEACEVRYYTKLFAVNAANHYGKERSGGRPVGGGKPRPRPAAKPAKPVEMKVPPPAEHGGYRAVDLDALRERAELLLRIAERGLTGGVLGDPPPGRSALDERTRAAAAAARSGREGSDVR
ncbi:hypothetical protein E4K66_30865 [Bradyrhizobium frederickii]|uniref:Myb-like domain-containing protein n=1 Tax=Bradyrhizobium frederickii TaxID=2560054 RepID=A0A4Y9KVQ2_9BRAD|nr:hypothetical protein [Bradyrhizobium frederickii]TFV34569.1 hypothetical protein E4K66_30865 [Bradyrhizobium frederickii]